MLDFKHLSENYSSVRILLVGASRVTPPSTTVCELGYKTEDRLFLVTRGRIVFDTDYGHIEANAGCVVYLPGDCTYLSHWESEDYGEYISLNFFHVGTEPMSDKIELASEGDGKKYLMLFRRICDAWHTKDSSQMFTVLTLFWEIMRNLQADSLSATMQNRYEGIYCALEYIGCNFEGEIDVEKLARLCKMSSSSFRREFKAKVGVSPVKYRNSLRMKRARELLESGGFNVTEAGRQVGIEDIFYFSKLYKREFGASPSDSIPASSGTII